jgi:AI-2 transport system ATP-binding protein
MHDENITTAKKTTPLVSLEGIWKVFDGVPVLHGVNIELMPGEIHALLGGNGSGKSTLMKVLSGVYIPDDGKTKFNGKEVDITGPAQAHELGIYYVPQEPKIFSHLSVRENLLMGLDVEKAEADEKIARLAKEIGFDGDIQAAAGSLSIANQQLLEIIRGLLRDARVLILDEPTSTLTFREVEALFERMRKLTARGIGIFFISHRLNEILEISDRISVLREGRFVLNAPTAEVTSHDLIRAMLPDEKQKEGNQDADPVRAETAKVGEAVLKTKSLSGEAFRDVSLEVRAGEVVGLAGLVGAGRTELARAIIGIDKEVTGEVWIDGTAAKKRSPARCQKMGLVYVPEDRHAHGIFDELPYPYTTTASILDKLGKFFISFRQEKNIVSDFVSRMQIKTRDFSQVTRTLSGGNQQKVVLSKALAGKPRAIILDEPTRGVDAQARQDVYRLIDDLKADGVGILMISSDMDEVIQVSDRVLVMFHGSVVEELDRSACQIERITAASFGVKSEL